MLDPQLLRTQLADTAARLRTRGNELGVAAVESMEVKRMGVVRRYQMMRG